MSAEMRKDVIMEDFRFLDDIKIHNQDGKLMLGDDKMPFNISQIFYEKEFVEKWLMGFALGNQYGINYFRADEWFAFSGNGTRAVMVVDDNHKPLLVIAPMIQHKLSQREFKILRAASMYIQQSNADTMRANDPNANLGVAKKLAEVLKDTKRITLPDMITPEFYEKHGIIPEVEQQVYYIKDKINEGRAKIDDITKVRHMLYANHKGQALTKEEREFLDVLSKGMFVFNEKTAEAAKTEAVAEVREQPSNPMEC
jgi:hypothetical protein